MKIVLTRLAPLVVSYASGRRTARWFSEVGDVAFCPECECEYDDVLEMCPRCKVALVSKIERSSGDGDDDVDDTDLPREGLVVIEASDDEQHIGQIRELLEESGIPCFLSNELSPAETEPSRTEVMIPREMMDDARRLIRSYSPR
jgi:hypothetical protein